MILKARISECMPLIESHYVGCEGGEPANLEMHSHFRFLKSKNHQLHARHFIRREFQSQCVRMCKIYWYILYNPFESPLVQSRYEEGPRWVGFPSFSHDPSSKHFTLIIIHMKLLDVLTESSFWLTWQATCWSAVCFAGPEREATYNYVAILLTLREPCLISSIDWDDSDLFTVGPGGNKNPPGKDAGFLWDPRRPCMRFHDT